MTSKLIKIAAVNGKPERCGVVILFPFCGGRHCSVGSALSINTQVRFVDSLKLKGRLKVNPRLMAIQNMHYLHRIEERCVTPIIKHSFFYLSRCSQDFYPKRRGALNGFIELMRMLRLEMLNQILAASRSQRKSNPVINAIPVLDNDEMGALGGFSRMFCHLLGWQDFANGSSPLQFSECQCDCKNYSVGKFYIS